MSAEVEEISKERATLTAIEEVNTAVAKFDRVAAGLAELKAKYSSVVFDVATTKGMKEAASARAAIRMPRVEVEKVRKECKAPILALGREIDARAAAITADLLALEEPIDNQIKAEELRREQEKQRRAEAERTRIANIHRDIETDLRSVPTAVMGQTAAQLEEVIRDVVAIDITAERFAEFIDTAASAKETALTKLREMHTARVAHEAEQERVRLEREELARQKAAQDEANRIERERIAAEQAERQRQIDEQMAKLRAEREENERIAREQKAAQERLEAQRREQQRTEDERRAAEHRRQQDELQREQQLQQARWAEINSMGHQVMIATHGRAGVRAGGTRECILETLAETQAWEITEEKFGPLYHVAISARQTAVDAITRELQAWDARAAEAERLASEQAAMAEGELADAVLSDPPPVVEPPEAFAPKAYDIIQLVSSEYGVGFEQALVWCVNAFYELNNGSGVNNG